MYAGILILQMFLVLHGAQNYK